MFERIIDGLSASTGTAVRLTALGMAVGISLFITTSFLCAAAFILVLHHYGPVWACLAGAGVFLLVTLASAVAYGAYKKELARRPPKPERSAMQSMLADPVLITTGLQIARTIGIKRLIPIVAIGALALGFIASRAVAGEDSSADPAE